MIRVSLMAIWMGVGFLSSAQAGCVSGAVAGGVIGHLVGHHGVAGAAVGCAVGHHREARERRDNRQVQDNQVNPNPSH